MRETFGSTVEWRWQANNDRRVAARHTAPDPPTTIFSFSF
jgi:hypothetical protein